ncbi:hypothetical protein D3C81_1547760 [compost metagenome]
MPPIGVITAAVPQAPASMKRSRWLISTSPSITVRPRREDASSISDRRVMPGSTEADFGVTNSLLAVMPKKLAEPTSSILVWVSGSR